MTFSLALWKSYLSRLREEKGFTLIELLVVIIIIGILAAIALPSYLNQAGKARGSEAKSVLGAINRAQQAYRYEQFTFANDLLFLDVDLPDKFYDYTAVSPVTDTYVEQTATARAAYDEDLKNYAAAATQPNSYTFNQIICESRNVAASGGTADVVEATFSCDTNSVEIE